MKYKRENLDEKLADVSIKHCLKCNLCWEIKKYQNRRNGKSVYIKLIHYYNNFPTYGKDKITCQHCSGMDLDKFTEKFYTRVYQGVNQ